MVARRKSLSDFFLTLSGLCNVRLNISMIVNFFLKYVERIISALANYHFRKLIYYRKKSLTLFHIYNYWMKKNENRAGASDNG